MHIRFDAGGTADPASPIAAALRDVQVLMTALAQQL